LPKTYTCSVVLGVATSTLDSSGEMVGEWDMSSVGPADVAAAALSLVGDIQQVPPMVSAVKVGGQRLHALARAGVEVDRPSRPVHVYSLEVTPTASPSVYRMDVE